eukprot:11934349-Karenia_brevis.AAC.1
MPVEMCRGGLSSEVISFNAAIPTCDKGSPWQRFALMPLETCGGGLSFDVINFNAAISACERGGPWPRVAP